VVLDPTLGRPARAASRPGRRPSITRRQIVDAAVAVGLDRFGVADVAAELGVSQGSLYRYVPSRERLYSLACDAVWSTVDVAAAPGEPWSGYLRLVADRASALARRHRGLAPYVLAGPYEPGTVAVFDAMIAEVASRSPVLTPDHAYVMVARTLHAALVYDLAHPDVVAANATTAAWHVRALIDGMSAAVERGELPPDVEWATVRSAVTIPDDAHVVRR